MKYDEYINKGEYDKAVELQTNALEKALQNIDQGWDISEAMENAGFVRNEKLQTILDNVTIGLKNKNSFFPFDAPFSDYTKDDETIDRLLLCEKYNIKSCLVGYYNDLKEFRIDTLFQKVDMSFNWLFEILNNVCTYISDNTDRPLHLQNKIVEFLQLFNEEPGFGQILQILLLQGVLNWFEKCNINENDSGYNQLQDLCNFVGIRLIEICTFYSIYFKDDEDKQLIDRFLYSTSLGKKIIKVINKKETLKIDKAALQTTKYTGIANKLSKWITGADDEVLESIIINKNVPDGKKKPEWKGRAADAHRFRYWIGDTEATMIKCFNGLNKNNFKRNGAPKSESEIQLMGSIWDVLKDL